MKSGEIKKITVLLPLIITFCIAILAIKNPPLIDEYIETLLVDCRFKIRNLLLPPSLPDNILIVSIDEKSLAEFGRWPWSRTLQAKLLQKVFKGNPKALGVDIFYPEPESQEADAALAQVFRKNRDKTVSALGFEVEKNKLFQGEINDILYDHAVSRIENYSILRPVEAYRVLLPPEPIGRSSLFGHVYSLADRDGKLRWDTLYIKYGEEYFPSFALRVSQVALGVPHGEMKIIGGSGVELGNTFVPADEFGRFHINYLGREKTIPYVSAADVIAERTSKEIFSDKIVLVGTSALATYDLKNTPFSSNMPGVEKHATVIANIIDGNFIKTPGKHVNLLVVILAGLSALLICRAESAARSLGLHLFFTAIFIVSNFAAFTYFGIRINLFYPLIVLLASGAVIISYRYFIEEKRAREIRNMFSHYVTERVVNELIRNPEMAKLGGERREVTLLFSDISGFTPFAEKHKPEEVVERLNEYLTAMTDIIFHWEGTLDKFIGDAIVAFWGAPLKQENHAELAVRCALHMIKKLGELQSKWASEGRRPLSMGVGLHTGEVIVGNIGAEGKKMDYTIVGDNVNLGARVESLTRQYDTNILMTEIPFQRIADYVRTSRIGHISIKGIGNIVVKGRETPVRIYEIKSLDPSCESIIQECADECVIHMREK